MNENITVLKDESLGGIEREYREVKRKAAVGERIKIVNRDAGEDRYINGDIGVVKQADGRDLDRDEIYAEINHRERVLIFDEEYVVLEPTDTIRIDDPDGVNHGYRMVDRKAAVGERVIVVNIRYKHAKDETLAVGQIGECTRDDEFKDASVDTTLTHDHSGFLNAERVEYHVLEPVESAQLSAQPPLDQAAANISALTAKVQALESRVATLEKANQPVKVAEGPADDAPPSFADMPRAKSLQEIRDEIVERAKADVKALETKRVDRVPTLNDTRAVFNLRPGQDYVRFEINRDKRTVVALLITRDGYVWARGIAKAAPNDVFNAHIGRAIALRRALGLEIPAEYLNVPNPEEPRVGDVVFCHGLGNVFSIIGTLTERVERHDGSHYGNNAFYWSHDGWIADKQYRIIDDSREEVGA